MLPNIVHWFTMGKFRSVHLGNTERKNPNLCLSTGDLTLSQSELGIILKSGKYSPICEYMFPDLGILTFHK